jgi:hypothetical protein
VGVNEPFRCPFDEDKEQEQSPKNQHGCAKEQQQGCIARSVIDGCHNKSYQQSQSKAGQ